MRLIEVYQTVNGLPALVLGFPTSATNSPPPLGLQVVMGERFAAMGINLFTQLTAGHVGGATI